VYQTPTHPDFLRNLTAILQRNRDIAFAEDQRITAEHAMRHIGGGPVIAAVGRRFDELHAEAVERVMRVIAEYVARSQLTPSELAASARPILETLGDELIARIPFLGGTLKVATEHPGR
jgi:hypothetical protein